MSVKLKISLLRLELRLGVGTVEKNKIGREASTGPCESFEGV